MLQPHAARSGGRARDEAEHYPMEPPAPIEAIKFAWSGKGSPGGRIKTEGELVLEHSPIPRFRRVLSDHVGVLLRP